MRTAASPSPTPLPLAECRVRASLLLKALHAADAPRALQAAARLCALPALSHLCAQQLLQGRERVQRKHALALVAHEQGYASWAALKAAREAHVLDTRLFFRAGGRGFLNRWFASYAEARASLATLPGFLFPYGEQFFVCEAGFVRALGLDPEDPDWARLGFDWVCPRDAQARTRLLGHFAKRGYARPCDEEVAHGAR
jgi:hypothetical protein